MKLFLCQILFGTCCLLLPAHNAAAQKITTLYISDENIFTAQNAQEGQHGLFADLFLLAAEELGRDITVIKLPWKRAQATVLREKGSAIGPIARTAQRKDSYQWLSPLLPLRISYLSKAERELNIHTLDTARKLKIGAKLGTASSFAQKKHGIPDTNIIAVPSAQQIYYLLARERIDAWLVWDLVGFRLKKRLSPNAQFRLVSGYSDTIGMLYFAANPDTALQEVALWRGAFETILKRGALNQALKRYIGIAESAHFRALQR